MGDVKNIETQSKSIFSHIVNYFKKIVFIVSSFFVDNETDKEETLLKFRVVNLDVYKNLKSRFEKIVIEFDPREAIKVLQQESLKDKRVFALCHDFLHTIGHTAFDKYGSFKEAVKYQSDFCNSGYIHGLFESHFNSVKDPLKGLSKQCADFSVGKRKFDLWQCHHGIGHGFMYLTGGDLDESLRLCVDGLQGSDAVSSCQNGVYMEVFNSEILAKEKKFVDPKNPLLTCMSREKSKDDCYLYIPTYISQILNKDFKDIFQWCDRVEFGYKNTCIAGIGSEAIKRNMNDLDNIFDLCAQAGSYTKQEACISGVVGMYMNQEGSYTAGNKLCEITPEVYRDICYKTVAEREFLFR